MGLSHVEHVEEEYSTVAHSYSPNVVFINRSVSTLLCLSISFPRFCILNIVDDTGKRSEVREPRVMIVLFCKTM
jgi:hypothetical protein